MTTEATSGGGWAPIRRLRSYEQVILAIEHRILAGQLHVGDRLPPERQLAELLGVSRAAVREALRALEALGILVAHTGSGGDAGSILVGQPSEAMTTLLRLHLALSNFTVDQVVEARIMIEGWSARSAARHGPAPADAELAELLDAMDDQTLSLQQFHDLDTQFHVAIATRSDNQLIAHLMQSLRDTMRDHMVRAFHAMTQPRNVLTQLRAQHREIYNLIQQGDGDAAAAAIEHHIRNFYAQHGR
ncbi:MAG: FCD domain-containing protein [Propionibacteriales bacterium]|nr:FCD domain-containing protein [Propionibacteriales bacterium]